ncbi:hypothetical protein SUGI_1105370 [Cryptomeria japonica]|nr:hypothetical protein SUGI_1105370 [Cryptomeria japonica]
MEFWKVVYGVMEFIGLFRDRPFSPQLCATESALQQTVPAQQSNKAASETLDSEKSDIESGFEQTASTRQIDVEMEEAVKHNLAVCLTFGVYILIGISAAKKL